jgi:DNA polymerase I
MHCHNNRLMVTTCCLLACLLACCANQQPALDKDIYKIRRAFTCEPGNTLIVADYGQLELRLLAHISACKSMLHAFTVGGDFHSRTAMGMYPQIAKEVESGKILLEWDSSKGEAPAPLLKEVYSTERRKAKMLNFSIAYGKTAMGMLNSLRALSLVESVIQ